MNSVRSLDAAQLVQGDGQAVLARVSGITNRLLRSAADRIEQQGIRIPYS